MILDEKFWLAICFAIFVAVTYKPIKKAILEFIDRKIDLIRADLKQAKLARIEAEEKVKEIKTELERVIAQRDNLLAITKADVSKISIESMKELDILLQRKERDAENKLKQLKVAAINDISKSFVQIAKKLLEDYLKENNSKIPSDQELAQRLVSSFSEKEEHN